MWNEKLSVECVMGSRFCQLSFSGGLKEKFRLNV